MVFVRRLSFIYTSLVFLVYFNEFLCETNHSREGVTEAPNKTTSTEPPKKGSPPPSFDVNKVTEGGNLPPLSTKANSTINSTSTPSVVNETLHNNVTQTSVFNNTTVKESNNLGNDSQLLGPVMTEKNDDKPSVAKKGVNFSDSPPVPKKKPLFTEPSDEVPSTDDKNSPSLADFNQDAKPKNTDYVVPIVAVILSVPILAIVVRVLYKRGTEWWQYRHYRRMDFLIDGMYNS